MLRKRTTVPKLKNLLAADPYRVPDVGGFGSMIGEPVGTKDVSTGTVAGTLTKLVCRGQMVKLESHRHTSEVRIMTGESVAS
jgi:hypothetical protein